MAGEADLEAHLLANLDAELAGDALGHGARGQTARLSVADQTLLRQAQLHAHLGDLGGLSGPGFAGNNGDLMGGDGGHEVLAAFRDGERGRVGDSQSHGVL